MNKPNISRAKVKEILADHFGDNFFEKGVMLFSIRGYFQDSMGREGVNDVGIYDDASVVISPDHFSTWNFNTDPSKIGWNPNVGKPFGLLQPGLWQFHRGLHHGNYKALRQFNDAEEAKSRNCPTDGKFKVMRCWGFGDKRNYFETGYYNVNDHMGAIGTSSWLCLTTPPPQYWYRYNAISENMTRYGQRYINNRLTEDLSLLK